MSPEELIAVITAGLDADEEAAKRLRQPYRLYACDDGHVEEPMLVDDPYGERNGEYQQWEPVEDRLPNHHNSWALIYDPSRVLADVAAKRDLLAAARDLLYEHERPDAMARLALESLARPYLAQETP
jgi:hypothetical protein